MSRWIVPLVALLAHGTALGGGYVWLDHAHLEGGLATAPLARWPALFAEGFAGTGYYRPLTALSLSIDALFHRVWIFHAVNLGWHAAAAMLTTVAAEALGLSRRAALLAGILFAVHPLGSLVASAIAFRSESMLVVFLLSFLWAYRGNRPWSAGLALAAAALTKETGLGLGVLFLAGLAWQDRRRAGLLAGALGLAAAGLLRLLAAPPWRAAFAPLGVSAAVGTRLGSLAKSGLAIALPFDRHVCDAFPVTGLFSPSALGGLVLAGAIVWLAARRRLPGLFFAFALVPSLQLVPVMRWWSPHYLYVALAFVAMLAAESVDRLGRQAVIAAGCAAALLGGVSFADGRRFASDGALWKAEVAAEPACREGHFYLGEIAREAKRWREAATHYERALVIDPGILAFVDRRAAYQNLGAARLEEGRFADARDAFARALEGTSDAAARRELVHDLALATFRARDPAEAARLLEAETARPDALGASLVLRAAALEELGRTDEAAALRARVR